MNASFPFALYTVDNVTEPSIPNASLSTSKPGAMLRIPFANNFDCNSETLFFNPLLVKEITTI